MLLPLRYSPEIVPRIVRRTSLSVATVSTDKDVRRTNRETISGQFLGQGLSALGRLIGSAVIFTFVGSLSVEMISATVQGSPQAAAKLSVFPESVTLGSPESSEQLIVIATDENGVTSDVTRQVTVSFAPERCATINSQGRVIPLEDGQSTLTLRLNNLSVDVSVESRIHLRFRSGIRSFQSFPSRVVILVDATVRRRAKMGFV